MLRGATGSIAENFARWLGGRWCLPSDEAWERMHRQACETGGEGYLEALQSFPTVGAPALAAVVRLVVAELGTAGSLADLMMIGRHAFEWVCFGQARALRGNLVRGSRVTSYNSDREPVRPLGGSEAEIAGFCGLRCFQPGPAPR